MGKNNDDDLTKAAQITVVFLTLYSFTFINVLVNKKRMLKHAHLEKKTFDRYASPQMHNADRLLGNFLEWSPIFLGLVWSLAATANLTPSSITVAWTYVALRCLYLVLLLRQGVASDGMNRHLWISTFLAYLCLTYLWIQAIWWLLLVSR